jgi:threonine dehydrogenase-like Zn-dependent dehydrogenase
MGCAKVMWHGGWSFELQEAPARELRAGEVRLRVGGCGICGSDVHIADGHLPFGPTRVLGHEAAGVGEEIGPGVRGLQPGDEVCWEPSSPCGAGDHDHARAVELLGRLPLAPLLTHDVGLPDVVRGRELVRSGAAIKVVVKP